MVRLYGIVNGVKVYIDRVVWVGDKEIPEEVLVNGEKFVPAIVVDKEDDGGRHDFVYVNEDEDKYLRFSLIEFAINVEVSDNDEFRVLLKGKELIDEYKNIVNKMNELKREAKKIVYEKIRVMSDEFGETWEDGDWKIVVSLWLGYREWMIDVNVYYKGDRVRLSDYVDVDRIYAKWFMRDYLVEGKSKGEVRKELKKIYEKAQCLEKKVRSKINQVYGEIVKELAKNYDDVYVEAL